jgi:zinc transporter 9
MASGSAKAVYTAIGVNSFITVTKLTTFFITGSGILLSEGIHSFADVLNQSLLALGIQKAKKEPDVDHPYGYGRDSFVWAMISAVGIFFLGCGFTLYHGIHSLMHPESPKPDDIPWITGVLIFSFILEGYTLWVAYKAVRQAAEESQMSFKKYLKVGPDPMAVAVLLEDAAAVFGVMLALFSIGMGQLTQNPVWDAIGSITIALLLGAVAIFLMIKNRRALLGQSVNTDVQQQIIDVLEADPVVEAVHDVKATIMGAESFRFKAEIDFDGKALARRWVEGQDLDAIHSKTSADKEQFREFLIEYGEHITEAMGDEIDRIEAEIKAKIPAAKHVDLESD